MHTSNNRPTTKSKPTTEYITIRPILLVVQGYHKRLDFWRSRFNFEIAFGPYMPPYICFKSITKFYNNLKSQSFSRL